VIFVAEVLVVLFEVFGVHFILFKLCDLAAHILKYLQTVNFLVVSGVLDFWDIACL
jgi:hypothetical protein